MQDARAIEGKYRALAGRLDEATLRQWAAVEARSLGRGGVSAVAKAVGVSRTTIYSGLKELKSTSIAESVQSSTAGGSAIRRVRAHGGGRKGLIEKDASILHDLEALVEPTALGDAQSPLRWTCKSTPQLARELTKQGHRVSQRSVCSLLAKLGYSLQSTHKTQKGGRRPARDVQFHFIAAMVAQYQAVGDPVISIEAKKKDLVGDFENSGRKGRPTRNPEPVCVNDLIDPAYDDSVNQGWISVGVDEDTAEFAVENIRRWWKDMGYSLYPKALRLLIIADCGSCNGYRLRLWRVQLEKLADEQHLTIQVCHFPPGTSKWNRIEHRMICQITNNWRGRPVVSREVAVNLIGNAGAESGRHIRLHLDEISKQTSIKVSDEVFAALMIERDQFHREWNYRFYHRDQSPPG